MDAGLIRPVSPTVLPASSQAHPSMRNAVASGTEIPAEQAVTPVEKTDRSAQLRDERERPVEKPPKRENYRDEETDTLVFRTSDPITGEVIRQIPEEAMLRLRQALASTEPSDHPEPSIDRSL